LGSVNDHGRRSHRRETPGGIAVRALHHADHVAEAGLWCTALWASASSCVGKGLAMSTAHRLPDWDGVWRRAAK
jgi:hypothetical protein